MLMLIIEDDEKLAVNLQQYLIENGHTVEAVYNGHDGLEYAQVCLYDLIILDLGLPDINGLDICRTLREKNINSKILILTGKDTTEDKITGLESGADDYMTKPFELGELLARARALYRRESRMVPQQLKQGQLALDTTNHQLNKDGHDIPLSPREFQILELLMRRYPAVVTRRELEQHIWQSNLEISSNLIDAYINKLRHKIDIKGQNSFIQTIWGKGYRINSDENIQQS
jgi:DNA-binding response OmpR family regulator